jgi:protocatechuate 3,4-dioxygenase beta subunit
MASHIHFSLFGGDITSRLITQMYFPGDPLLEFDPMVQSIPLKGRDLLISKFDLDLTEPDFALGYRFDIVLRGHYATPFENL